MAKKWTGEILAELVERTGAGQKKIAEAMGISSQSLKLYINGRTPPFEKCILLADFFAVPLDFLCGRCDKETAEKLLSDYSNTYEKLRRAEYETVLFRKEPEYILIPKGYIAPWPYNLLDDIFQEPFDKPINDDQMEGLTAALNMLNPRERNALLLRYSQGKSLNEIAEEFKVTRERVRQIIAKAVRKLRHPARQSMILYGKNAYQNAMSLQNKEVELNNREKSIEEKELYLQEMIKENERYAFLNAVAPTQLPTELPNDTPHTRTTRWGTRNNPSDAFLCLELSVRSYNALLRSDIATVKEILKYIRLGKLHQVRNLGVRSCNEIILKVSKVVGYNCYDIYGIDAIGSNDTKIILDAIKKHAPQKLDGIWV